MSGPTGDWHTPARRHLRFCPEDEWGQCPDEPDWQTVPIVGDGLRLGATRRCFRPDTQYGGGRRSVHLLSVLEAAGSLVTRPWPQLAALLLDMALCRTSGELASYCMDLYTPSASRRALGAVAERLELTASGRTGDMLLSLSLRGRSVEANDTLAEADFDYSAIDPVPFRFARAVVQLQGQVVTGVEQLSIRVENGLAAGPSCTGLIAYLAAGQRSISVELRKLADDAALHEALREGGTLSLSMTASHPLGHVLSLALPALHPTSVDEEAEPDELARAGVNLEAGIDEAGDDITYELTLEE